METETVKRKKTGADTPRCDFCYGPLGRPHATVEILAVLFSNKMKMCMKCLRKWGKDADSSG
jgi:hypothetical protein